jgi:methionyl-tRNA formyltransferase
MRIVFMGSPAFAVPALNALAKSGHEVAAVYCQPPRPAGRGKGERKTAVQERAEALGLEVRVPRTLKSEEEQARFAELRADLAVVAAYGLLLPQPVLDSPKLGCVNIHASLLPRWRGAAPIQRAILAGDARSGITLMQMDAGLDTGPMLLDRELTIDGKTAGQVTEEMAQLGAEMLLEWLKDPQAYPPRPQPAEGVTHAPKICKAEARIDWSAPAAQIERQVRAFAPTPGAWFEAKGERVKLLAAAVESDGSGESGRVLDGELRIDCGTGVLRPIQVQRAGRAAMSPSELLRGFAIPPGTVLP